MVLPRITTIGPARGGCFRLGVRCRLCRDPQWIDGAGIAVFQINISRRRRLPRRSRSAGHRQLAGPEAAALTSHERQCSRVQARAAIPLISAHISNARALAARDWLAVTWPRWRWKRLLIWSWAQMSAVLAAAT